MSDPVVSGAADVAAPWLSKLLLRPRAGGGAAGLRDAYAIHQALWRAFPGWSEADPSTGRRRDPDGRPTDAPPFLWRADRATDEEREAPTVKVLVQSTVLPAWDHLAAHCDLAAEPLTRALDTGWSPGARLRFLLRANPTRSRKDNQQPIVRAGERTTMQMLSRDEYRATRGKRVAIWSIEEREAWVARKLSLAGARLATTPMTDAAGDVARRVDVGVLRTSNAHTWRWHRPKGSDDGQHDGVDFEGVLEVVDPTALRTALPRGFGAGKAMGFGLLSLAPMRAP
jgi:CRISPR system Cascade subunit CasE